MTDQPEPYATRRELDTLTRRVDQLDQMGTRGVGVLQTQLTDLAKDVAKLETSVDHRFNGVDAKFEKQHQDRLTGRRWMIGTTVAGMASVATILATLFEILSRLH